MMPRWSRVVLTELWLPVLLVLLWWFASASSTSLYFPPLHASIEALHRDWFFANFRSDLVPSLKNLTVGYLLTLLIGISAGTALGLLASFEEVVRPIVEFLRSVPGITLLPLMVVALGLGDSMRVGTIIIAAVWPTLLNTINGVRSVDLVVQDVARSLRLSRGKRLRRVVLPAAAPQIFAGARTSLSIAVVVMVVTESVGATGGIGYFLLKAEQDFDIASMWGTIILLGLLGYILNSAFRAVEALTIPWHRARSAQGRKATA